MRHKSNFRWDIIIIMSVSFLLTYTGYRYLNREPASVFVITPDTLTYGDTTVSGILRKDAPIGVAGNYLLILPDTRPVMLDSQGLDKLIGSSIEATGFLIPPEDSKPLFMTVNSITLQ